jgi:7,8-dihydropterin-6-yl-methyl-4-(beta-D-ribofuranosyl)aminobenzene 5'-phosphate synthase
MEVITLVENLAYQLGIKGEHGLSFLVKAEGKQILFDTGQSGLLVDNAKKLGEDLSAVDVVVISHGHYDHTGGLRAFFEMNDHAPVLLKPDAFSEKFSKTTGEPRFVGIDRTVRADFKGRFHVVAGTTELAPGLLVVPTIHHYYDFEQSSPSMMMKKNRNMVADTFDDELFMVFNHPEGITIFAGCAHRGIGNICRTAMAVTGNADIRLVLGGTHLKGASTGRIEKTVSSFDDLCVHEYGLCHCTGLPAFMAFSHKFKEKVRYAYVGTHFTPYD